MLIGV